MNDQFNRQLKTHIALRYWVAIALIAILSTIAFYSVHSVLQGADKTAFVVNASGKQRMLSQRLALDAYRIQSQANNMLTIGEIELAKYHLKRNAKEMREANKMLSMGPFENGRVMALSPAIEQFYFGDMALAKRVDDYVDLVLAAMAEQNTDKARALLGEIHLQSQLLLTDLDKVVKQYQLEGESTLAEIKRMEYWVWALTIFVLLLEVIFIFQPMTRYLVQLSESRSQTLENLENLIELRTLHLEKANEKLALLASHDPLTGLKNRLNLESDIEQVIEEHAIHGAPFAVLMFDLDFFKQVNDQYGHDVGDFVIIEVAKILMQAVRVGDSVYRAGGEEFVVLLNRLSLPEAKMIAEKIRGLIEAHLFDHNGVQIRQTISCGLYHSSLLHTVGVKRLLKLVDNALYQAKDEGRNCIVDVQKTLHSPR